jgi:hypothetical protein
VTLIRNALIVALLLVSNVALARVQRFALLIGHNQGHAPDMELRYAESDAAKFGQVLRDLGKFEPGDTVVLRGEDAATVRSTLISLNDRIRAAQSIPGQQALLFVYYSGHADAQALRLGPTRLDFRELAQLVRGSAATFRLLVVDACRSGALTRLKGGRVVAPFDLVTEAALPGEGIAFLTASAENEDAQESDELRGSFFTNAFVSGLMGAADRDGDGAVALDEAYGYARDATLRATSRTFAGPQHPSFHYELRGQDSLVLTTPGLAAAQRGQLVFPKGMRFLITAGDANGAVVGELEPTAATPQISVRPGRYFLRGRTEDYLLEGEINVAAGERKAVAPKDLTRVAYARLVRKGVNARDFSHSLQAGPTLRARLPNASGPCWGAAAGYRLDLPAVTLGARVGTCRSGFENHALSAVTAEYAAVVELRRLWDFTRFSVLVGLDGGLTVTHQTFESTSSPPARTATSPVGAAVLGALVPFATRHFILFEGLAEAQLLRLQESALIEPRLRWGFAPRAMLSAGFQL